MSDATTVAGMGGTPGGIWDPSYISGIGIGGSYALGTGKGGDGLVVITAGAPVTVVPLPAAFLLGLLGLGASGLGLRRHG